MTASPTRTRRRVAVPAVAVTDDPVRRAAAFLLAVLAGLAVWLVLFAIGFSGLVEHHDQSVLYAQFRQQLASQVAPVDGSASRGSPVALLDGPHLPRLVVVEGTTSADLRAGPGLTPGSPLPGQSGSAIVLGRSTTYGAPFGGIDRLTLGDKVTVTTGEGVSTFSVVGNGLAGTDIPPAFAAASARLVLETSESSGFLGVPTPHRTRLVYLVSKTAMANGPHGLSSSDDKPNAWHAAGLYPLVLWLQLLLVVVIGATVAIVRGGSRYRAHTWAIAAPVGIAALWGASSALLGVLPNLL